MKDLKTALSENTQRNPTLSKMMEQKRDLEQFVSSRGITAVYHFTPVVNLPSICKHGILSRADAEAINYPNAIFPDKHRYDGATWAVCCSIQWPNHKMLYWASKKVDFALLLLDPSVLWEFDCVFLPKNAAHHDMCWHIPFMRTDDMNRLNQLEKLFPDEPDLRKSDWRAYPDDVQAEVLIDASPIDMRYCRRIIFKSMSSLQAIQQHYAWPTHIVFDYDIDLFTFRPDHIDNYDY